jgi:hypothetical protein
MVANGHRLQLRCKKHIVKPPPAPNVDSSPPGGAHTHPGAGASSPAAAVPLHIARGTTEEGNTECSAPPPPHKAAFPTLSVSRLPPSPPPSPPTVCPYRDPTSPLPPILPPLLLTPIEAAPHGAVDTYRCSVTPGRGLNPLAFPAVSSNRHGRHASDITAVAPAVTPIVTPVASVVTSGTCVVTPVITPVVSSRVTSCTSL